MENLICLQGIWIKCYDVTSNYLFVEIFRPKINKKTRVSISSTVTLGGIVNTSLI